MQSLQSRLEEAQSRSQEMDACEQEPSGTEEKKTLVDEPDGAEGCQRALQCSRVCPTGVYPAKSIHDLLKLLDQ